MTWSFTISTECFGRFQHCASTHAGFRRFRLFAGSFRREAASKDRYRQNRRVVEHKGLLHSCRFRRRYLPCFKAVPLGTNSRRMCTFVHVVVTRLIRGGVRTVKSQAKAKTVCRGVRIDELLIGRIERAAKGGGFSNPSAFIRAAIERELAGRESGVDAAEERIAAESRSARPRDPPRQPRPAGAIRLRRFVGRDIAHLRRRTAEGRLRPGRRTREGSVRSLSEKRRRRDGRRFSSRHDGVAEAWRRELTTATSFGLTKPPTCRWEK